MCSLKNCSASAEQPGLSCSEKIAKRLHFHPSLSLDAPIIDVIPHIRTEANARTISKSEFSNRLRIEQQKKKKKTYSIRIRNAEYSHVRTLTLGRNAGKSPKYFTMMLVFGFGTQAASTPWVPYRATRWVSTSRCSARSRSSCDHCS